MNFDHNAFSFDSFWNHLQFNNLYKIYNPNDCDLPGLTILTISGKHDWFIWPGINVPHVVIASYDSDKKNKKDHYEPSFIVFNHHKYDAAYYAAFCSFIIQTVHFEAL